MATVEEHQADLERRKRDPTAVAAGNVAGHAAGKYAVESIIGSSAATGVPVAAGTSAASSLPVSASIATPTIVSASHVPVATTAAAPTGLSAFGTTTFGQVALPIAGAYGAYNLVDKWGQRKPMESALSGAAAGAAIGNFILPGPGAIIGAIIGGIAGGAAGFIKTGKHEDQVTRDQVRANLKDSGFLDDNWNMELADGSIYNIGIDGGPRAELGGRRPHEPNSSHPLSGQAAGWVGPLATIITGGNPGIAQNFAGYFVNAVTSNADTMEGVRANVLKMYEKLGIDREGALQILSQMRDSGQITQHEFEIFGYGIGTAFQGDPETYIYGAIADHEQNIVQANQEAQKQEATLSPEQQAQRQQLIPGSAMQPRPDTAGTISNLIAQQQQQQQQQQVVPSSGQPQTAWEQLSGSQFQPQQQMEDRPFAPPHILDPGFARPQPQGQPPIPAELTQGIARQATPFGGQPQTAWQQAAAARIPQMSPPLTLAGPQSAPIGPIRNLLRTAPQTIELSPVPEGTPTGTPVPVPRPAPGNAPFPQGINPSGQPVPAAPMPGDPPPFELKTSHLSPGEQMVRAYNIWHGPNRFDYIKQLINNKQQQQG